MSDLVYSTIASLDGYVADAEGKFGWSAPDEEVHSFVNDLERPIGTYLYGRKMYDVMVAWETMPPSSGSLAMDDYAGIWRSADKVVYSRTLGSVTSERTRIERDFEADAVRELKAAATSDISIGGPQLAALAFRAGLVDQCHLFVAPVIVGGGNRSLPDDVRLQLELIDEHRFGNGVIHLHYRSVR